MHFQCVFELIIIMEYGMHNNATNTLAIAILHPSLNVLQHSRSSYFLHINTFQFATQGNVKNYDYSYFTDNGQQGKLCVAQPKPHGIFCKV